MLSVCRRRPTGAGEPMACKNHIAGRSVHISTLALPILLSTTRTHYSQANPCLSDNLGFERLTIQKEGTVSEATLWDSRSSGLSPKLDA